MGEAVRPPKAKLVMAVTWGDPAAVARARKKCEKEFGAIDSGIPPFDFHYTDYYQQEMGNKLQKCFWSFFNLIPADRLPDIKIFTNSIETIYSKKGKRTVNLDPGYLADAKIVLATTKNYDHRVYLKKGIYGDVHLRYRHGKYEPNFWTYPDYQEPFVVEYFEKLRHIYFEQLNKRR